MADQAVLDPKPVILRTKNFTRQALIPTPVPAPAFDRPFTPSRINGLIRVRMRGSIPQPEVLQNSGAVEPEPERPFIKPPPKRITL